MDSEDLFEDNSNVELPMEVQEPLDINPTDPENPDAEYTEILSEIKEKKRKQRRNKDQA